MAIFPLIAEKATQAVTLKNTSVTGNELPGSSLAPYDSRTLSVSLEGKASGTADAYTATLVGDGVPAGLIMRVVLASLDAQTDSAVDAASLTVSFTSAAGSVTKAMTAADDEFTVIHMGKGIFESYQASTGAGFVAANDTLS
tara:strand:+ start:300 stop:725 length:426 start_codon:yes stop_codon:yes gene_type:complete